MADDILMAYRDEVTRLIHERDEARAALATMQRRAETAEAALRISVRDGEAKDAALDRQLEISERLTGRLVDAELALARVTALADELDDFHRERDEHYTPEIEAREAAARIRSALAGRTTGGEGE